MSELNNKIDKSLFLVKHRKKLNIILSILLILLGFNYLPINLAKLSLSEIFLNLYLCYAIIDLGRVYKTINQHSLSKTFLYSFGFNLLGLIIVIAMEFGETSFYRALTFENIIIQISLRPILFTIGSFFKDIKLINREK